MMITLGYTWANLSFYSKYIFQIQLPESLILLIKKKNFTLEEMCSINPAISTMQNTAV